MSSASVLAPEASSGDHLRVESEPVNTRRAIASEWIKFKTLRSNWAVLGVAMVAMVLVGLLLMGSLGVLFVSGEYSTGMIRSTFAAVPKRIPVLWAKLVVFVAVAGTSMIDISFVAFLSAQGLLSHYRTGFSLGDPGVLRVVLGTGIYLTLIGVIGSVLAWIVRSTRPVRPGRRSPSPSRTVLASPRGGVWSCSWAGFSLVWLRLWCCRADGTRSSRGCRRRRGTAPRRSPSAAVRPALPGPRPPS